MKSNKTAAHVVSEIVESIGDNSFRSRNPQLESKIIGLCFRKPSELQTITANLRDNDFSDPRHKLIYSYADQTYRAGKLPDRDVCLATVKRSTEYEIDPEDFDKALHSALDNDLDIDVEAACGVIHDLNLIRQLLGFAKRLDANISEGKSSAELIGSAEEILKRISGDAYNSNSLQTIDDVIASSPLGIKEFTDPPLDGCPSPIAGLNEYIQGFRPGQLVIIGARPAVGKSGLLCQIGYFAAKSGFNAYLYSHEMSSFDIWTRIFCQEMGILSSDFLHRTLSSEQKHKINEFIKGSASRNFHVSDRGGKTPLALRSEMARIKARVGKVDMVLVDYLQLMRCPNKSGNRYQEVSEISRSLKELAMEFNCRMIAAAQLNRQIDTRQGDIKPQLSDLRESGELEQSADLVIFPHRPSLYVKKKEGVPPPDDELIIPKQRRGPTGTIKCKFKGEYFKFVEVN